jgi:3-isopropylmalate/(R)-2-methylmalate dehydratase small subunit
LSSRDAIIGRVWVYQDDINTDYIAPRASRFDMLPWEKRWEEMGRAAMEGTPREKGNPDFGKKCEKGDIIVAGLNFGCGSSREEAALVLKAAGAGAVVAESFARIWYRNAVNNGLLAVECRGVAEQFQEGDEMQLDVATGKVKNRGTGSTLHFKPIPEFVREMLDEGGLIPHLKKKLKERARD